MDVTLGRQLQHTHTVDDQDTAVAVGSGDVPVLATPRMIAWLEAVTAELSDADEFYTSVGVRIDIEHLRPSPVGTTVTCSAEVIEIDGRNVVYGVRATQDHNGREVVAGEGRITRVSVDRKRFLEAL